MCVCLSTDKKGRWRLYTFGVPIHTRTHTQSHEHACTYNYIQTNTPFIINNKMLVAFNFNFKKTLIKYSLFLM